LIGTLLLLLLDYAFQHLETLRRLVRPLLELLVEHLLVLILNQIVIGLVVFIDNSYGFGLQRRFEELLKSTVIRLVLLEVNS
jgi:hypothetical protein